MNATATSTAADSNTWQPLARPQRQRHVEHEHDDDDHHRRHRHAERGEGDSGTRLFMELKLQVSATLGDTPADDTGELQQALQDFTQTLFSALGSLFAGAAPQATDDKAASDAATNAAKAPATTNAAAGSTVSLDLRVRLRYTSLSEQAGDLTRQLAQPEGQAALPGSLRTDLSLRFDAMLKTSGRSGASTLPDFLTALAARLAPGNPATPASPTATDAAATTGTPATTTPAAPAASVTTLFTWRLSLSYRETTSAPSTLALAA